jgi:O-antigen ligase
VTPITDRPPAAPYRHLSNSVSGDLPGSIDTFQRIGYGILLVFLFLIYSRIFDVKLSFLHIPGISYRIILLMVLLSRAFLRALKTGIGKAMYAFTIWMVCCVPTSMWRMGSVTQVESWVISFVVFLATAGLVVNFRQARSAAYTLAWALFVLTLIAVLWGSTEATGRLFLPRGKFANPNEMAQALLLGMPLWWLVLLDTASVVKKAFAAGVIFFMLVVASKCGSRGALIAFAVTLFCLFMRAELMGKLKLIVGGFVVVALLAAMMPGKLLHRYVTFTQDDPQEIGAWDSADYDPSLQANAISSTKSRQELLKKSIKFTFQHPLFGVGPGMFVVAEDADAKASGKRMGLWQGTHNSYTQVSSEMGIPGLIAYVAVIFFSLKKTSAVYAKTRGDPRMKQIANCALCIHFCLIVYAVSVLFDYVAYSMMLSVFAGVASALDSTAPAEMERIAATPASAQPIPFEHFRPRWRPTAGVPSQA